jgi:hypothetical protein
VVPEHASVRQRSIKQYRKGPQIRAVPVVQPAAQAVTVQAAPVKPKTPRLQCRIDAERRYAEKRRLLRLQARSATL